MEIFISLPQQSLELFADDQQLLRRYSISTASKGAGEENGSFKTPRGKHIIRAKIGQNYPENTVFVRRRPTGELWSSELHAQSPNRDWILSRILWLSGCQVGVNRLASVDTMRRYIYLHGTHELAQMGIPGSIGCVRMRNADIIELFDLVAPYLSVNIGDYRIASEITRFKAHSAAELDHYKTLLGDASFSTSLKTNVSCLQAFNADGQLIGMLIWQTHPLSLCHLVVLPAWRRKGVATNLLRRLLELLALDLAQVDLQTLSQTADGQAFLAAHL